MAEAIAAAAAWVWAGIQAAGTYAAANAATVAAVASTAFGGYQAYQAADQDAKQASADATAAYQNSHQAMLEASAQRDRDIIRNRLALGQEISSETGDLSGSSARVIGQNEFFREQASMDTWTAGLQESADWKTKGDLAINDKRNAKNSKIVAIVGTGIGMLGAYGQNKKPKTTTPSTSPNTPNYRPGV